VLDDAVRADAQARFARLFPKPRQEGVDMLALSDAQLRAIRIPVALVHGRDDRVIPFRVSEMLAAKLPDATLHPIDRCGHWVQIEKKQEFLDIVTRFMEDNA
jgi:pimeloyl-ACP methyl ester carboxylesterase